MRPKRYFSRNLAWLEFVEWGAEDKCFAGRCPELMLGGFHGNDEAKVYAEFCTAEEPRRSWERVAQARESHPQAHYKPPTSQLVGKHSLVHPLYVL
jgi:hypothetical protein